MQEDSITIPLDPYPGYCRSIPSHLGEALQNGVEIIPQLCNGMGWKSCGNHGVGTGLIFESIVSRYFGRIRVD
jgi:hypothetical protein